MVSEVTHDTSNSVKALMERIAKDGCRLIDPPLLLGDVYSNSGTAGRP